MEGNTRTFAAEKISPSEGLRQVLKLEHVLGGKVAHFSPNGAKRREKPRKGTRQNRGGVRMRAKFGASGPKTCLYFAISLHL